MSTNNPTSHNRPKYTRRTILKTFSTSAVAASIAGSLAQCTLAAAAPTTAPARHPIALQAEPFNLTEVRLLPGPFLDAQKRDEKYLLSLEPDRLLHNFRINAGLEPKAPVYGGWESVQMWADIRAHGHTLGHYLSACAMMFASTGNDDFKKRCDTIVADLQECQIAGKTGLICAFPDKAAQFDNLIAGRRAVGVPWYTLHKILAGLRDTHLHTANAAALDVLTKVCDWAIAATEKMTDAQFERMLGTEHGGMNEVLADVFALTKNEKYLTLAERFCHKVVLDPLAQSQDKLDGLHSNTQIPKIVGFARLHIFTGEARYAAAAEFFWATVTQTRSFVTGGNGEGEHFFPVAQFAAKAASAKTMETCCSHNMLKLTRALFTLNPTAVFADYYERTLFNTILASQDSDSGMMTYFQSTRPGYMKLFCTPTDSFWCCTGTGIENHAKYGDSIYFKSPGNDALYINQFISSTLNWKEAGITLKQTTTFPESGKVRLEITAAKPVEFKLIIRHPAWCTSGASVTVNGSRIPLPIPGSFLPIMATWKTGDVVEVDLPMELSTQLLPNTTDQVALTYGPITLVGLLGKKGLTPGSDIIVNERTYGAVLNDPMEVPPFNADINKITDKIKPTEAPLTFKATGLTPAELTLIPYYKVAHERYNMYWKVTNA